MAAPAASSRFTIRGLVGVVLIALGIGLGLVFNKTSDWSAEAKTLALATAYCAATGGSALFSSYVHQREFKYMKTSLMGLAAFLCTMLLLTL